MILVENTTSSIIGIPSLIVNNRAPKNVILKTGINSLENDVWETMKKNKIINDKIDNEILKVVSDDTDLDLSLEDTLQALPTQKALKVIKATFDLSLLKLWQSKETRVNISKAIDGQLKLIEFTPANDKDNNETFS